METLLIICLVLLLGSIGFSVFLWTLLVKVNDKLELMSGLMNKAIMDSEDSKKYLTQVVESQSGVVQQFVIKLGQENRTLLGYQKSFIEQSAEKARQDLDEVKERLDYLTTEVTID